MFKRDAPYNDLPLLPPQVDLETKAVLKKAISANIALSTLRETAKSLPNQGVLIQALGLQEAKLSSEIENVVTTNDELYRAFSDDGKHASSETKEVLCYKDALWHGYSEVKIEGKPLGTRLYEELYRLVKNTDGGVRSLPGTKLHNNNEEVIYTPPEGEKTIRDKLANLEKFIYEEDTIDPLVKLAVMHYQFEAIHPFYDGNGRVGRILNVLYLVEVNRLDVPVLYLSRYILSHKKEYYQGLRGITEEGKWEEWILYILAAIEDTANETTEKINRIKELMKKFAVEIREKLPRIYSKDLVESLFLAPYCRIHFLEKAGIGHRQTVGGYLSRLSEHGFLKSVRAGREIYYINEQFFNILSS